MSVTFLLNFGGVILNIIGTIVLTFSISNYLTSIHGAIAIHDMILKSIVNRDNRVLSADVANLLKKGVSSGRVRTIMGLIFIVMGFGLQLVQYILELMEKYRITL
jgi:hypothetical protein